MADPLQTVYERARGCVGEDTWPRLSAHEQTTAVYQEFRALDAVRGDVRDASLFQRESFVSFGMTGQSVVRLRLTGQMEAWTVTNENVLPTGRKTRALLAAIALSAPRPAMRGRLAELLWSRRPEEQARASLRQEIQLLLKALAPAKAEILHVTRDHLSLAPDAVWVDVEQIMRAAASKSAALSLLDGELLEDLDGIDPAFDVWLATERERVRDRARSMAEVLLREQADPATVIPAAHRLLQIDRAHEEAWRALMRAHAEQGERGMAIQAYDRCRVVLADLLDASPSAETQTLLTELRGPSSKRLPSRPPHQEMEAAKSRASEDTPHANGNAFPDRDRPRNGARVGVLPMRCIGLPEDASHLGPSLANEITTALSRFRWISVICSNSLARFAREIRDGTADRRARDLDFLLDGAIQRSRNKLRITLRLLDLREDNQVVWARRFDRAADDPLSVQEEVASEVAAQIDPVILLTEAKRCASRPDPATSAYDLILRSIPLITRLERDGFMRAGANLSRAVALEPDHAAAHGWYASWHAMLISQYWAADPREAAYKAGALADRAILLDPYSAGAFTVAGHVRAFVHRRPHEGAALHERALELNPNFSVAWALSALTQILLGNAVDADRRYRRYKELSPLDPYSFMLDGLFATNHLLRHEHNAAVNVGRAVTQLNPSYAAGYRPYLSALGHLGNEQEAAGVLRRLLAIERGVTVERCLSTFPLENFADREHFAQGLRLALMPESDAGSQSNMSNQDPVLHRGNGLR